MDTDEFVHAISSVPSFGSPAASPSGERLAFVSDETGQSVVYVQEVTTGERHPAIEDPELAHGGGPLLWLDDDELLFHLGEGGWRTERSRYTGWTVTLRRCSHAIRFVW